MTSRAGDTLPVAEISILWLTAGLSCDGDTIAMTAATQPSLEDLLTGGLPWGEVRRRSITSCARVWRRCAMPRVELFGTATCPYTRDLREWLELRGTEFDEYDVEADPAARERMRTLAAGERIVPVLVEDGRVVQVGWQGRGCTVGG